MQSTTLLWYCENMEDTTFDEVELNIIYMTVKHYMAHNKWDLSDDGDWSNLVVLKDLQAKVAKILDGGTS